MRLLITALAVVLVGCGGAEGAQRADVEAFIAEIEAIQAETLVVAAERLEAEKALRRFRFAARVGPRTSEATKRRNRERTEETIARLERMRTRETEAKRERQARALSTLQQALDEDAWDVYYPMEFGMRMTPRGIAASVKLTMELALERDRTLLKMQLNNLERDAARAERRRVETAAAAVAAAERAAAAEAAAPARRAELTARLDAVERMYESIFATHEQAAEVLTDIFEKRWARDRIAVDRTTRDMYLPRGRAALEDPGPDDLDRAEPLVEAAEAYARERLAKAEEALEAARAKVR